VHSEEDVLETLTSIDRVCARIAADKPAKQDSL
jgi:hypothetical protein